MSSPAGRRRRRRRRKGSATPRLDASPFAGMNGMLHKHRRCQHQNFDTRPVGIQGGRRRWTHRQRSHRSSIPRCAVKNLTALRSQRVLDYLLAPSLETSRLCRERQRTIWGGGNGGQKERGRTLKIAGDRGGCEVLPDEIRFQRGGRPESP
jgi:hypothetical protein